MMTVKTDLVEVCSSRKYPYCCPPPTPHSLEIPIISLNVNLRELLHPLGNSNPFCGGSKDIFWN